MSEVVKNAIILAGGEGKRLRPHTDDKPKPMVEVNGKPLVVYQIEQLKAAGVKNIVFACGYKREVLRDYFKTHNFGVNFSYSEEETPLGRGGAIKAAMASLPGDWQEVIVTNGDNIWKADLAAMFSHHQKMEAVATDMTVQLRSPYGIVESQANTKIKEFLEKPLLPYWLNAGVYIFSREIQPLLPDIGDHETTTFPQLAKSGKLYEFKSSGFWKAVDTVKDLEEAEKEVKEIFG